MDVLHAHIAASDIATSSRRVGLGIAFVWMLWEIEQVSKRRRSSDRLG
jgi:hypothetical protein